MKAGVVVLCLVSLTLGSISAQPQSALPIRKKSPLTDRSKLPPALQNVPLERLSSGALMLLDRGGDLVEWPAALASREQLRTAAATISAGDVALDLRVGNNIRLGADPVALPAIMRAQAEPHIARSLGNPDLLVGVFQEGRFTDAGAVDCGYSISRNGGISWTRALIPNLTMTSGGPYFRATDPVAAVDASGNLYLETLAATDANFVNGAVVVSKSTNGGVSFAAPRVAFRPPNNSVFPDKDWIAINTFSGTPHFGRIVCTYTLFSASSTVGAPIQLVYSDNGGTTWSAPVFVNGSGANSQGSQPVFLPDGKLAVVYWNFNAPERIEVAVSSDGGATFAAPKVVANVARYVPPNIRSGVFLPAAIGNRTNQNLYVVYQATFAGAPRILFTKSTNSGTTWSSPIAISNNPPSAAVLNPAIGASPDGQTLTVAFYDGRNNPGSHTRTDMYFAQSLDGGATWKSNLRLTSVSTDATLAPLTSEGYMLGDYLGVAESTNANVPAVSIWVDTRTGNPDPFVTRVGIAPQADFNSWRAAHLSLAQINNPAIGGQNGDPDNDGEDNVAEYRTRTDPNSAASIVHTARELNFSTRERVLTGNNVLIGGFIITGTASKNVILRAIGPSLAAKGISGPLQNPILELHNQAGTLIAINDNWRDSQQAAIQATGIPPSDNRESAILRTLAPGRYTAIVRGVGNTTGIALVEAYDLDSTRGSRFGNVSTRGFVQTNQNVMIAGFIVGRGLGTGGTGTVKVLLRGIGPSLAQAGITNSLQDPLIQLFDANGALLAQNDNWRDTQQAAIQATGIPPMDNRESALIRSLRQGNYTVKLFGRNSSIGVALIEVYNVP